MSKKYIFVSLFAVALIAAVGLYVLYRYESYQAVLNGSASLKNSLSQTQQTQAPSIKYLSTTYPFDKNSQSGTLSITGQDNQIMVIGKLKQLDTKHVTIEVYTNEVTADVYPSTTFTQAKQNMNNIGGLTTLQISDFGVGNRVAVRVAGNDNALSALEIQKLVY